MHISSVFRISTLQLTPLPLSYIYPSRISFSLTQVLSATVFGYVVANISTIVRDFNSKEQNNNLRLGMLKEYLNRNNSPASVSNGVLSFFRQALRKGSNVVEDKQIMMRLPHFLRTTVYALENKPLFASIPIFKHIKSNSLKLYLLNLLTFCHAEKGYRMIKAGEPRYILSPPFSFFYTLTHPPSHLPL